MKHLSKPVKTTTFEALLGILSMGPMTGYEIRQRIDLSIGNFWSESFGQIYPALNKLLLQGLVDVTEAGRKGRKVYSLTPVGRERLREWLSVLPQPEKPRNELLLKLFFGVEGDVEAARAHVLATRAQYIADLERFAGLESMLKSSQSRNPGLPYFLMTLNYGFIEARAIVAWADQTLASLDEIAAQSKHLEEKP
jgi:PadR family transcriptional regulator, regulatory protein AphA